MLHQDNIAYRHRREGSLLHRMHKVPSTGLNTHHCPVVLLPCPVGQGLPQLPGEPLPLCGGR